jgi:hypothetical protein
MSLESHDKLKQIERLSKPFIDQNLQFQPSMEERIDFHNYSNPIYAHFITSQTLSSSTDSIENALHLKMEDSKNSYYEWNQKKEHFENIIRSHKNSQII